MKKFYFIAVLLITMLLLAACGGPDEAELAEMINMIMDEREGLVEGAAPAEEADAPAETGGGETSFKVDEHGFLITYDRTTDEDGNPITLECGLAEVIDQGAPLYQIKRDKDGDYKYNAAGYFLMEPAPGLVLDEDYVCVDGGPMRVDGGSVFRLMYAQKRLDKKGELVEWRGLGADWYNCCFVDFDDVKREAYVVPAPYELPITPIEP